MLWNWLPYYVSDSLKALKFEQHPACDEISFTSPPPTHPLSSLVEFVSGLVCVAYSSRACTLIRGHVLLSLNLYIVTLHSSLLFSGCVGVGVCVCTRVCGRVVICIMFGDDMFFVVLCVCTYSKHKATTLRSNLQQFNRPGKANGDRNLYRSTVIV